MRKYFLFAVNEQAFQIYKNDVSELFKILYSLSRLEKHNYNYGLHIYNEILNIIDVNFVKQLLISKYGKLTKIKNKYLIENEIVEIRYSCITILTKHQTSKIFKQLKYYYNKIIVCDFENKDYFYLDAINKDLIKL